MFSISISPFLCASMRFPYLCQLLLSLCNYRIEWFAMGEDFLALQLSMKCFGNNRFRHLQQKKKRWEKKASIRTNWMIRVFVFLCFMCSESFHCWHRKVSRIVLSLRRNVWPLTVVCLTDAFSYSQRSSTVDTDILGIFNLKTLSKSWYAPCFQFFFKNFRRNVLPSLC